MKHIAFDIFPSQHITKQPTRWLSLSTEPWFEIRTEVPLAGFWIRIVWRAGLLDAVSRPVLRCHTNKGIFDILFGAAIFGANEWIGYIPKATTRITLSPIDRIGEFGFVIEGLWRISAVDLWGRALYRSPKCGLLALGAKLIGRPGDMYYLLRQAIATQKLSTYTSWRRRRVRLLDRKTVDGKLNCTALKTKIAVFFNHQGTDIQFLRKLISDLRTQSAPNWLALICVKDELYKTIFDKLEELDPRIQVRTGPSCLEYFLDQLSDCDLFCSLPTTVRISDTLVEVLASAAARHPEGERFLIDTDRLSRNGSRSKPRFWNHGNPLAANRDNACKGVFWRVNAWQNSDYEQQRHIAAPRSQFDVVTSRVLLSFLTPDSTPMPHATPGTELRDVSTTIIIPSRNRADLLRPCIESILCNTDGRFEIIVVDNGSTDPEAVAYLAYISRLRRVQVLPSPGPFNFSKLCNAAAAISRSDVLMFLNNDTTIVQRDWLVKLASHAMCPEVGAVGAKLLYPSGKIQHSGVVVGLGGQAGHFEQGASPSDNGYFGHAQSTRTLSAVTGACLAVEAEKFRAISGFDEFNFPVDLNDIDLCLRLAERGFQTRYVFDVVVVHHESATRGQIEDTETLYSKERSHFRARWIHIARADPYFAPALSLYQHSAMLG